MMTEKPIGLVGFPAFRLRMAGRLRAAGWARRPSSIPSWLVYAQDLDRDVVWAAVFLCGFNQAITDFSCSLPDNRAFNLGFPGQTPDAVRSERPGVPGFEGDRFWRRIRRDVVTRSESSGEDVALRVGFGLLGAEHAVLNQSADIGMIVGKT